MALNGLSEKASGLFRLHFSYISRRCIASKYNHHMQSRIRPQCCASRSENARYLGNREDPDVSLSLFLG